MPKLKLFGKKRCWGGGEEGVGMVILRKISLLELFLNERRGGWKGGRDFFVGLL